MTDTQIISWLIGIVAFAAGFGLGHGRGQIAGINWCIEREKQFDAIYGRIRELQDSSAHSKRYWPRARRRKLNRLSGLLRKLWRPPQGR